MDSIMSQRKLAEIVVRSIEFFELVEDAVVEPDTAINILESIAADLEEATSEEHAALKQAASERLAWFLQEPDQYGYSPRKMLGAKHRQLLERIASGEMFERPGSATPPPSAVDRPAPQ
jgi:hypothetical protein